MAIVTYILRPNEPLTPEEEAELAALKDRPVEPDEDCPEFTEEQWAFYDHLMKKYNTRRVTKEMVLNELKLMGKRSITG